MTSTLNLSKKDNFELIKRAKTITEAVKSQSKTKKSYDRKNTFIKINGKEIF